MTKIYVVTRVDCASGGKLCEPIGAALTEADAVSLCETEMDCISEIDAGRKYPTGGCCPDIRMRFPLSPCNSGWQTCGEGK